MNELTLEQIISLATNTANIVMSAHANKQCLKREINAEEILEILLKGSIIEQYPTDFPFRAVLCWVLRVNTNLCMFAVQ